MMRKISLLVVGAMLGAGVAVGVGQGRSLIAGNAVAAAADTYRQLNLFGDVFERIRADYVEQPDDAKLVESAINGMLSSLDPHSSYMSPKSFKDMQVQTRGEFGGLGIEVTMENGLVKVVSPIDDTPAAKAGVQPGDFVTHIDGEAVMGMLNTSCGFSISAGTFTAKRPVVPSRAPAAIRLLEDCVIAMSWSSETL